MLTYMQFMKLHMMVNRQSSKVHSASTEDIQKFWDEGKKLMMAIGKEEVGKLFDLWLDAGLTLNQRTIKINTRKNEADRALLSLLKRLTRVMHFKSSCVLAKCS